MTYYIPYEEVPNLFTLADWLALPYSSSFTSQSGVLNVAIAHNCPVLASALPTFVEIFKECQVGILVPPDDSEHLRNGIAEMMQEVGNGKQWQCDWAARKFSWEQNVRTAVQCYLALTPGASQFEESRVSNGGLM